MWPVCELGPALLPLFVQLFLVQSTAIKCSLKPRLRRFSIDMGLSDVIHPGS